ncbi:hypothetical protein OC70_05255 [Micrococcus luteus]|nr:hypothetical protein OC70_05255 [Micrococcus luteus]
MQIGVPDPPACTTLGSTACFTFTSVSTPAAPVRDLPDLLHVQVHHVPRAAGGDLLRSLAQVLTRGREVWQPGDAQSVQPPAHSAQAQLVAFRDEVVMDAAG